MKKAKRGLLWMLVNGAFAVAVYYGIMEGHKGALNIIKFGVWWHFIVSISAYFSEDMQGTIHKKGRSVWRWLDRGYDLLMTIFLAYSGWFFSATLWLLGAAYQQIARDKGAELAKKKESELNNESE